MLKKIIGFLLILPALIAFLAVMVEVMGGVLLGLLAMTGVSMMTLCLLVGVALLLGDL